MEATAPFGLLQLLEENLRKHGVLEHEDGLGQVEAVICPASLLHPDQALPFQFGKEVGLLVCRPTAVVDLEHCLEQTPRRPSTEHSQAIQHLPHGKGGRAGGDGVGNSYA